MWIKNNKLTSNQQRKTKIMKKLLLILFCLPLLLATNSAKAQSCPAGQTEIDFVVIGANGGWSNYVLLQETTVPGNSSFLLNTPSITECMVDGLCYDVTVAGSVIFEVYQGGILVATPVNGDNICFPLVTSTSGCTDITACNYDASANVDDGSCDLPNGCGNPLYLEYAASVTCSDATACVTLIVNGCTDASACNFDASANVDDSSCDLPNGCGDALYLEYDAAVTCSDATACVTLIVNVCTDASACNFDATANVDDGSCLFPSLSTYSLETCDSYIWNSNSYNLSGVYTFSTINANGCDSTATLNLTINNSTSSTATETECDSYTWPVNGSTYISTVIDTVIGVNAAGCIETSILDLTINNSTTSTDNQVACDSYIWPVNGLTYTSPSMVTVINVNAAGCTETSILNLTISGNPVATILQNGFDLEVTISDIYFWNTSEITQTITPTANGWYWCIVTDVNGCMGDTAFYEVINIVSVVNETINPDRKIIKITDILGQETPYRRNTPLFYIYDDGTVEKRIVIE